jgi:DNA sulfur modification protein DndC
MTLDIKILDKINKTIEETKEAYLYDSKPWILGYSGGKDSTTTLQLVWYALRDIPKDKRTKHIYVISSDTLVETPLIKKYLIENQLKINEKARQEELPISAEILTPIIDETFWVNLIGRGYPAPQQMFRWCTNRLKIKTSSRFIQEKISKSGEVVIVLGTRRQESDARANVMRKLDIKDSIFSRSNQFSAAFSYSPIRDWSTWDVWQYLMQVPNPWGGDNQTLAQMYRNAEGECPFVVDDKSPPCGTSRFGCWVCTLVEADKSVESLIESGETYLQPLLDFRNHLSWTQDPEVKEKIRDYKLRRGAVAWKRNYEGEIVRGPYLFWFRKELLEKLLLTQKKVNELSPGEKIQLITVDELERIRQIWRLEEGDWEDSVPQIYKKVFDDVYWTPDDNNPFNRYDKEELVKLSKKYEVPERLVTKLIDIELQTQGMSRRSSIFNKIEKIFNEEWRTEEEMIEKAKK